jgi:hypothetical protein
MHPAVLPSILISTHFLADWVFQSRDIAENKSKKFSALYEHVSINFFTFWLVLELTSRFGSYTFGDKEWILLIVYCVLHGVQDWFIWRGYAKFFHKEGVDKTNNKAFWNTIAVDQFIHLTLLMVLFVR